MQKTLSTSHFPLKLELFGICSGAITGRRPVIATRNILAEGQYIALMQLAGASCLKIIISWPYNASWPLASFAGLWPACSKQAGKLQAAACSKQAASWPCSKQAASCKLLALSKLQAGLWPACSKQAASCKLQLALSKLQAGLWPACSKQAASCKLCSLL